MVVSAIIKKCDKPEKPWLKSIIFHPHTACLNVEGLHIHISMLNLIYHHSELMMSRSGRKTRSENPSAVM